MCCSFSTRNIDFNTFFQQVGNSGVQTIAWCVCKDSLSGREKEIVHGQFLFIVN